MAVPRKRNRETRSPFLGLGADRAAVHFDDRLGDCQPQPHVLGVPLPAGWVGAVEAFENLG